MCPNRLTLNDQIRCDKTHGEGRVTPGEWWIVHTTGAEPQRSQIFGPSYLCQNTV